MTDENFVYLGDSPVRLRYTVNDGDDNSAATKLVLEVTRPDKQVVSFSAAILTSDSTNRTAYADVPGDSLPLLGDYWMTLYREFGSAVHHHLDPVHFSVRDPHHP